MAPLQSVPSHESAHAKAVRELCLRDYKGPDKGLHMDFAAHDTWAALHKAGTALWLDSGDIDAIKQHWTEEFEALTTNNTLLNKEVQKGIYDELVPEVAATLRKLDPKISPKQLVLEIAFVLNAVHGLKLVSTFDADVSVELHTDLADDTEASYQYGRRYAAIEPKRFIVKVPLTPSGVLAARKLNKDGIRVNFTLGFSARQNFVISSLAAPTYVNIFMGRLNSFVADHGFGDGENVGEKATLASQRMLRDEKLKSKQIGASIRNGQQVFDLAGMDVMTIPLAAAKGFLELQPDLDDVQDRTATDPAVKFHDGVSDKSAKLDVLWDIDAGTRKAVKALLCGDAIDTMDAAGVLREFANAGAEDLFPVLNTGEAATISKDGKIPIAKTWQDRVTAGTASWDGLLTASALAAFAKDQQAMDDVITKHIGS